MHATQHTPLPFCTHTPRTTIKGNLWQPPAMSSHGPLRKCPSAADAFVAATPPCVTLEEGRASCRIRHGERSYHGAWRSGSACAVNHCSRWCPRATTWRCLQERGEAKQTQTLFSQRWTKRTLFYRTFPTRLQLHSVIPHGTNARGNA